MEGESGDDSAAGAAGSASAPRRWTCDACGCHTNTESDTSCSICGTSQSGMFLAMFQSVYLSLSRIMNSFLAWVSFLFLTENVFGFLFFEVEVFSPSYRSSLVCIGDSLI